MKIWDSVYIYANAPTYLLALHVHGPHFTTPELNGYSFVKNNLKNLVSLKPETQCAATTATYCDTAAPEHKMLSSLFRPCEQKNYVKIFF